jgi:ATP-binding cassette, subfamily B, bacterial MsbA
MTTKRSDRTFELLGRLWREHLIHHKGRLALVLALTLLMAGTTALYPVVINHAFDMFTQHDRRILYQIPALVVVVTGIKALAQYFQSVQVQQVVLLVIRELQGRMFAHLARADLARLEREAPAQLAAHFTTDAATIREALTRAVNGVADVVTVIGLVGSMIYLNWVLSLIAAAMYPLAIMPIERIGKRVRKASGGMQERVGETAALLNESFAQARTVRAYRLEASETRRAEAAFQQLYRSLLRMTKSRSRVEPVLEVLGGVAVAAVIGFEGWRAAVSDHALGDFTGFVAALLIAARPLRALGSLNAALQEGLAGMIRVFAIIDEQPTIKDAPDARPLPSGRGHVVFDNVGFVYPDGRTGLAGLTFEALPGTTVALVGPSGGGKSTALALIPRLIDATAGAVRIDGANVRTVTLATLRDSIAYVGQDSLLFDDTVAANIAMGRPRRNRGRR